MKKTVRILIFVIALFLVINKSLAYYNTSDSITGVFTARDYKITLNSNNGVYDTNSITIKNNSTTLPIPKKDGYTFLGYSTSSNGNVNYSTNIENVDLINNNNLYAKWETISYSINYDLNGGNLSNQKTSYTIEESFTLPTPTKNGYSFTGWTGSNGTILQSSVTIPKGTINNLNYKANWSANSYNVDVNPIIDGTAYNSGLSGYTFDVWINGILVGDDVIDFCQNVEYGSSVRVKTNSLTGRSTNYDKTIVVGTDSNILSPSWIDNIGPIITTYSLTNLSYYGYNSQYNYHSYNYHINVTASDVSGVSKICYSLWSNNKWLDDVCHYGGSNSEDYVNVIQGNRITRITAYDERGNSTTFNYSYNIP